jgi:hypothetical protein
MMRLRSDFGLPIGTEQAHHQPKQPPAKGRWVRNPLQFLDRKPGKKFLFTSLDIGYTILADAPHALMPQQLK